MTTEIHTSEGKRLTIFESAIIGFFVGVIVAAYLTFVTSTGGFVGVVIDWVSLRPLVGSFGLPDSQLLVGSFIFFILVYTVYGAIIGFLIKKVTRARVIMVPTILLLAAIGVEQGFGSAQTSSSAMATADFSQNYSQTAAVISAIAATHAQAALRTQQAQESQQYFGEATSTEAVGDLNGDGKDDVAFFIHRDDAARGTLYYLSAALATTTGHTGTDLLFLGNNVVPQAISIASSTIDVSYTLASATTTRDFYFEVTDNSLRKK